MRRVLMVLTLIGTIFVSVGCDDKPKTEGSGNVQPGKPTGAGPAPPAPSPPPK